MSPLKLHHAGFTSEGRQSHQSRKWSEKGEEERQIEGLKNKQDGTDAAAKELNEM